MKKFLNKLFKIMLILTLLFVFITTSQEFYFHYKFGSSIATNESKKIGEISLYSSPVPYPTIDKLTGHSWIYIKNTSDDDFYINGDVVPSNQGISFGTTGHPAMDDMGLWVNLEKYNSSYKTNISITDDFYLEDLEYVETYLDHHDKWDILYNCTTFASALWNNVQAGRNQKVFAISPRTLYNKLYKTNNYDINTTYNIYGTAKPYIIQN